MRSDFHQLALIVFSVSIALLASSCVQKMGKVGHQEFYLIPPEGTIARGELRQDTAYYEGKASDGTYIKKLPMPITRELLTRGRERYNVYCSPCHAYTGNGNGMIVQRGFLAPPSYHTDRLRNLADGHIFKVISHGAGAMYSYGDRVAVADRWAIVAYIRALQLSENMRLQDLRPDERKRLEEMNP